MNKVSIGKVNAISLYLCWFFLLMLVIGLGAITFDVRNVVVAYLVMSGFCGVFLFGAIHFLFALFVRCPSCNKLLTGQGLSKPVDMPNGDANNWSTVAVKWFTGTVFCIHCGAKVNTNTL